MKVILSAQVCWLHQHSPRVGQHAATKIVEIIDLLTDFPDLGVKIRASIRKKQIQFGRDGFVIRYKRGSDAVTVVRILQNRQYR